MKYYQKENILLIKKIADKYGVSKATIRDILLGKVGSIYRDNNTIQYN